MEGDYAEYRPALVVSRPLAPDGSLFWAVMITAASRGHWPGDIAIGDDHEDHGLPKACLIRTAKLSTLATSLVDRRLGRLPGDLAAAVQEQLRINLALNPAAAR